MMAEPALDELGPVSPPAISGISERDFFGVAGVPSVLGQTHLLGGSFAAEEGRGGAVFQTCSLGVC